MYLLRFCFFFLALTLVVTLSHRLSFETVLAYFTLFTYTYRYR